MSFITNILNIVDGGIELLSLIICANLLLLNHKKQIKNSRLIACVITYMGISMLWLFLMYTFDNLMGPTGILLYYIRLILAMGVLYNYINIKIIYLTAFFDLSISFSEASMSYILSNIMGKSPGEISPFVMLTIQITVLILILYMKRKIKTQMNISVLSTIPRHIYILLLLTIIILSALSSLISFPTDSIKIKEMALIAAVMILTVIFGGIVVSLFLNIIAKQHYTTISQMMEKQVELQINHYKDLEKMDAEISRFRHDYTNHLQSILSLIQMNEYSQAEEYIQKLKKIKYSSVTQMFYTGNKLADAILSDKSSLLDESFRIEYSGIIPDPVENVDLCIILSNSLDNAIEACHELSSPGVISVYAAKQQGYFVLSIKNPTICTDNYYDIPTTTKSDKDHHGMGLYNIESTVKKNDGQMKIKCENGMFEIMITMKIKSPK